MNKRKKLTFLSILLVVMITYVGWVFYISEPTYIDNAQTYEEGATYPLHKYDFVVIPRDGEYFTNDKNEVLTGMVLQVDDKHALVKKFEGGYSWEDYFDLIIGKSHYRVIGTGTIYHKVNHYIGFNIMMITTYIIIILIFVLGFTTISTLVSTLSDNGLI